jgi:superfamily II DNA or RNA helicase
MKQLSPFDYYSPPVVADFTDIKVKYGDYQTSEVALRMDKSEIIGDVIATYRKLADGKRAICYCASCEHAEHVAREFNLAGIPAAYIDGKTPDTVRKLAIEQFRTGVVKILTNVDLVSEGFDVPNMEAVILLRPTQSVVLFIQQAMRAMRADPDNPNKRAVIIDHVGNVYRHGLPDEDREWTLEGKMKKREPSEIKIRQCPECYYAHLPAPKCPNCGFIYAVQAAEPIKQTKGELLQIKDLERKAQKREIGQARTRSELEQIAIKRGYSLRWVDKMLDVRSKQAWR